MKELGEAINESLSDSEAIAEVVSRIKDGGYDIFLVLEATIGVSKQGEKPADKTSLVTTLSTNPEFKINDQDLKFLKSLAPPSQAAGISSSRRSSSHFSSCSCVPGTRSRKRSPARPFMSAQTTSASTSKLRLRSGSINCSRGVAPLGKASRSIRAIPLSLMLVLIAFTVFSLRTIRTSIFTGWRK